MSLLQIRSLKAPEEIRRSSLNTAGTQTGTASGNASYNEGDEGVFTCYFGRLVEATDYPRPTTPGGIASISITVKIYDNLGVFINEMPLNATQANIRNNNGQYYTCFKLSMSDADFRRLGGGSIYVHVVIDDSAENVSFRVGFTGNYHETIRHVKIYDEKSVVSVCWSSQSQIPANNVASTVRTTIALADDAYIHLRTSGLWGQTISLRFYERGLGDTVLASIDAPVYYNRKVVVVSMKYLLACYCRASGIAYNPGDAISLSFYVKAEYVPPVTFIPVFPLLPPWTEDPYLKESANLLLDGNAVATNANAANNGTILAQVGEGEVRIVGPERYRDFLIGYMCHVEGVGKLVDRNNNISNDDPKVTVYPLHTYEIMLNDLVACGLVTLDEAIYMAPVANPESARTPAQIQVERTQLEYAFNKTTQRLSGGVNDRLINRFLDNSYRFNGEDRTFANGKAIRKLLAQIQHKPEVFGTADNEALRYICRDAWQNNQDRVTTRYDARQECPFGEFFVNYIAANFKLFVGRYYFNADINRYDAQPNIRPISPNQNNLRDGIAFHKGTAFASIGCLTFNRPYFKKEGNTSAQNKVLNNYGLFNNKLYSNQNNVRKLNFVCIDERNAISPPNDLLYYDLIKKNGVLA